MAQKTFPLDHSRAVELLEMLKQVQDQRGDYLATLEEVIGAVESYAVFTSPKQDQRVIFRKFPHNGEIIALLPDEYNQSTGDIGYFCPGGQHGGTAPDFGDTKPAEWFEYSNLHDEMERDGYTNLRIVKGFGKLSRK